MRSLLVAVLVALVLTGAAAARGPIRVTLRAENHHPHPTNSPSWQWGYCVRVTTAAGRSVASTIHLQIMSGNTRVEDLAVITLRKGYDHWCGTIGGEANALLAVPRGRRLLFQAVVTADGMTVTRNWPFVVA